MYSSVNDVLNYTGIKYETLGLSSKTELETMIETWLIQVKSLIDRDRGRDLERDLDFGDKITLVDAEKAWNGVNGIVRVTDEDIDEVPILPKGKSCYAVNEISTGTGILANNTFTELDLSTAKTLDIDILSYNSDVEAGDLQIILYSDTKCSTIVKTLDLPLMYEYIWKRCRCYLMDSTLTSVKGIGINQVNPIGSYIYVGEVYTKVIPKGIHNIAMRACANMVKLAVTNRESPVVTINDMNAHFIEDQILTAELKKELSLYPIKPTLTLDRIQREDEEEGTIIW